LLYFIIIILVCIYFLIVGVVAMGSIYLKCLTNFALTTFVVYGFNGNYLNYQTLNKQSLQSYDFPVDYSILGMFY